MRYGQRRACADEGRVTAADRRAARVSPRGHEDGAVAIIFALSVSLIMLAASFVLDFGLVRVDRQVDKSAADAAATAGLHALNAGDSKTRPFVGVCTALRYLKANGDRFSALSDTSGTWTTGTGVTTANGCTNAALRAQPCTPGLTSSWAKFAWSGTWRGTPLRVVIQSGYSLTGTGWSEDALPAASGDSADQAQGCDQLAVIITQNRKPTFGSLATSSDLVSSIRSVGRVALGSGSYAPAMLLLKRTGCPVLQSGAAGGGSFIHVLGAVSSNGISQPGTIHSDSDAQGGCSGGSNQNLFLGKGTSGIVAYAAPQVGNTSVPDPTKPGQITSVAAQDGKGSNFLRDLLANVYGSTALNAASAGAATKAETGARSMVTRQPVDGRYISGVRTAISQANSVFSTAIAANGLLPGLIKLVACKPTQLQLNLLSLTASSTLYIDCTSNGGFGGVSANLTINAGTVIFNGAVAPSATLSLPNAHHVYVAGTGAKDSIILGGGGAALKVNTTGNTDPVTGRCSEQRSASRAVVFVKGGDIKESNGSNLQLCKTTVYMMGGSATGCVPTYDAGTTFVPGTADAPAPTSTPCNGAMGSGQFTQNGGDIDWTAPDQYDVMTTASGLPDPALAAAWSNPNGQEDLALWSESGSDSNTTYNMSGGGVFNVRGVYMVPNADPFTIGGGGTMNLKNAQFVASTIALNGNTTNITMSVDPNAAVSLPRLLLVGLVR